jgi:hypothetical protein
MAKKRKSRSSKAEPEARPKAEWSQPMVVQLLAWLDVTIKNPDIINFEETIESQLNKKCGVDYTYTQVVSKLKTLWAGSGRNGPPGSTSSYQVLLKEGHTCLVYMTLEEHLNIETAVREFEVELRAIPQTPRRVTRRAVKSVEDGTRPRANSSRRIKHEEEGSSFHSPVRQTPTPNSSPLGVRNICHTPDSSSQASKRLKVYGKVRNSHQTWAYSLFGAD